MNLDFRIIELQKRGISLISLGKRAECWFFPLKRAFANFFRDTKVHKNTLKKPKSQLHSSTLSQKQ